MKTLLIMRHGKSSWKDTSLVDHQRPLKKRGRKNAAQIGKLLAEKQLVPALILSSSAERAKQTAEILIDKMGFDGEVAYLDDLYMAEPETFYAYLRKLQDVDTAMIIGHNPGLETLLQILTDEINSLPTAATAQVKLNIDAWNALNFETTGKLKNLWLPRSLD